MAQKKVPSKTDFGKCADRIAKAQEKHKEEIDKVVLALGEPNVLHEVYDAHTDNEMVVGFWTRAEGVLALPIQPDGVWDWDQRQFWSAQMINLLHRLMQEQEEAKQNKPNIVSIIDALANGDITTDWFSDRISMLEELGELKFDVIHAIQQMKAAYDAVIHTS